MYRCPECGRTFDYPDYVEVCFEDLYGVGSMFRDQHYTTFANCPRCGEAIDIECDIYDEEYDNENDE